jgi:hypothetical protein
MPDSPYTGLRFVLASMHGKERALLPAFQQHLQADVVPLHGVDTDLFGTFNGEIPRTGTAAEAALRKAELAARDGGTGLGLGSEGSYGPDPAMPFLPLAVEHLAVVDLDRGLRLVERLAAWETNFAQHTITGEAGRPMPWPLDWLSRIGWPAHAVMIRSLDPARPGDGPVTAKGITDADLLARALAEAGERSPLRQVRLETDMRADRNPTRMALIARLALRLAERLACLCPACRQPGWGIERRLPGLPCAACGTATSAVRATLWGCPSCTHQAEHPLSGFADPGQCPDCNP